MREPFKATKVTDHVYWVGAIDWALREFHGHLTNRGTTYNAYLILADKITLVDTVKAPFKEELLSRIASVIDPGDITYIVSNHSEMDHSGCLPEVIEAVKPEKVFASVMGADALAEHFQLDREIVAVKDGETLSLGNMNLSFMETRMLHWPDSMFTYLAEDGVLFSQDVFSMHLASTERFDDEIDDDILEDEEAKYFANILLPLSTPVSRLLEKIGGLDVTKGIVATDHGPIWRNNFSKILALYAKWAAQKPTKKAAIVYDTMYESTASMARAIAEGIRAGGADAKLMPLRACHRTDVATEMLHVGALVVGSPTFNNNIFPTVADALTYLKGLKPRNLIGAAFGSYGWSGEAIGQLEDVLRGMKVELVGEGVKAKYVPDDEDLARCYSLGMLVAERLKELCQWREDRPMKAFGSVDEILDFAIGKEEEAFRLYTNLGRQTQKSWMRQVFEEFASEERGHKAKLQAIKEGRLLLPAADKVMDLKIADYVMDVEPSPGLDYQDALVLAMKEEKAAFRLYSDLAAATDDETLRATLLALAQEEARHKLRFEIEYDDQVLTED